MLLKDVNFLLQKKNKKQPYGREQCKILAEVEKKGFVKYGKKYYKMRKNTLL